MARRLRFRRSVIAAESASDALGARDPDQPRRSATASVSLGREGAIAGESREVDDGTADSRGAQRAPAPDRRSLGPPVAAAVPACAACARGPQIEEAAAADRPLRGRVSQDETVARGGRDRSFQHQLHESLAARRDRFIAKEHDPRTDIGGGVMHRTGIHCPNGLVSEESTRSVASMRAVGACELEIEHHVAAGDRFLADPLAGKVERAALARAPALDRAILRVDRADARGEPGRAHDKPVSN